MLELTGKAILRPDELAMHRQRRLLAIPGEIAAHINDTLRSSYVWQNMKYPIVLRRAGLKSDTCEVWSANLDTIMQACEHAGWQARRRIGYNLDNGDIDLYPPGVKITEEYYRA